VKIITRINVVAGATALVFAAATPAMAASYYSRTHPLKAYQDGTAQAEMYGTFSFDEHTYLRNDTVQRDPRPGGDAVFERTKYYYDYHDGENWRYSNTDQGPKTTSSSWYSQYDHDAFHDGAYSGLMKTQVCEDHGIWRDPCSAWPQQSYTR